MTIEDKKQILDILLKQVESKIQNFQIQIQGLTIDAQNDAKGSAGDKHEVGLAMMHLEQEKLTNKLTQTLQQKLALKSLSINISHQIVGLGSLIEVKNGFFFVSEALPHFNHKNNIVYPISTQAPIYQYLKGKKSGDEIVFNGNKMKILNVI